MFSTRILYEPGFVFAGSELEVVENRPALKKRARVLCRCLHNGCGKVKEYNVCDIKSGGTRTCGCTKSERPKKIGHKNGEYIESSHPLYKVWSSIKKRCYLERDAYYKDYGGRGIVLCDEWLNSFPAFKEECISIGWSTGLQIDRINNDGNYEPGNIHFVTCSENNRNRRDNVVLTIDGITCCLKEHAERRGASYGRAWTRLRAGWDIADLFKPPRPIKEKSAESSTGGADVKSAQDYEDNVHFINTSTKKPRMAIVTENEAARTGVGRRFSCRMIDGTIYLVIPDVESLEKNIYLTSRTISFLKDHEASLVHCVHLEQSE